VTEYKKAILAGGCFWGMGGPDPQATRRGFNAGGLPPAGRTRTRPTAITLATPEAIEIVYDPSQTDFRNLLEFFFQITIDHEEPPGQRRRHQLPVGDLLYRR